jgi:death-on-curing protein
VNEPQWLEPDAVMSLHDEQISTHGGMPGVRDAGALESALARPRNKWLYGEEDLFALAAAYGFGLARNHPFSDGNKRIAAIAALTFVELNGSAIIASADDVEETFLALAAGSLSEDAFADWLRGHAEPAEG